MADTSRAGWGGCGGVGGSIGTFCEGVFSLGGARHLREDAAAGVDEPVADLRSRQMSCGVN